MVDLTMPHETLYVIGNGFDLWHGIKSRPDHFRAFARARNRTLFDAIEAYLPLGPKWADLESALAEIDIDFIVEDLGHFMMPYGSDDWSDAGHHDFQYEVGRVVENLSVVLRHDFATWIRQLDIPTYATAKKRLKALDPNGLFLTFNYTPTLDMLYGVPVANVLHIHGRSSRGDADLVLGHAWDPATRASLNNRPDIADLDTRMAEANQILDGYFSATFKPSDQLIRDHRPFFDQLGDVRNVFVLGHSLSYVDEPYFVALLEQPRIAAAEWIVACCSEAEGIEKLERLYALGIDASHVATAPWANL